VKKSWSTISTDAISAKACGSSSASAGRRPRPRGRAGRGARAEKVVGFKKIKMARCENVGAGEVELPAGDADERRG